METHTGSTGSEEERTRKRQGRGREEELGVCVTKRLAYGDLSFF